MVKYRLFKVNAHQVGQSSYSAAALPARSKQHDCWHVERRIEFATEQHSHSEVQRIEMNASHDRGARTQRVASDPLQTFIQQLVKNRLGV